MNYHHYSLSVIYINLIFIDKSTFPLLFLSFFVYTFCQIFAGLFRNYSSLRKVICIYFIASILVNLGYIWKCRNLYTFLPFSKEVFFFIGPLQWRKICVKFIVRSFSVMHWMLILSYTGGCKEKILLFFFFILQRDIL